MILIEKVWVAGNEISSLPTEICKWFKEYQRLEKVHEMPHLNMSYSKTMKLIAFKLHSTIWALVSTSNYLSNKH